MANECTVHAHTLKSVKSSNVKLKFLPPSYSLSSPLPSSLPPSLPSSLPPFLLSSLLHTHTQLKGVKAPNVELKQSLVKAVKAIDKLSAEKATMGSQLEQQAL